MPSSESCGTSSGRYARLSKATLSLGGRGEGRSPMALPGKIWTNSGDSHCIEPPDLYRDNMPARYAERMPRSEFVDGDIVTHIDGKVLRRRVPGGATQQMIEAVRAQGGTDNSKRMADLDEQGVWGEVVFPSLGLWYG